MLRKTMCLGVSAKTMENCKDSSMSYVEVDLGGMIKDDIVVASEELGVGDYVIVRARQVWLNLKIKEEVKYVKDLMIN